MRVATLGALALVAQVLAPSAYAEAHPQRIVSLSATADEIVLSLMEPDRVAAVSRHAADPEKSHVAELAAGLPAVQRDDVDAILALDPDLVITSTLAPEEVETLLVRAGARVLRIATPRSLEDVRKAVLGVGRAVGAEARALALLRDMDRRLGELRDLPPLGLRALYYTPGGWTSGAATSVDAVLIHAGLGNAARGVEGHRQVSLEEVIALDPDVILVARGYARFDGWLETLRTDRRHQSLRAVREGRIVAVPARSLYTFSHFLPAAARDVRARVAREVGVP